MIAGVSGQPHEIPVVVVVPPRVLLLDLAGPLEVLRKANLEQAAVRFAVTYVGPNAMGDSSIGLGLAGRSSPETPFAETREASKPLRSPHSRTR